MVSFTWEAHGVGLGAFYIYMACVFITHTFTLTFLLWILYNQFI